MATCTEIFVRKMRQNVKGVWKQTPFLRKKQKVCLEVK